MFNQIAKSFLEASMKNPGVTNMSHRDTDEPSNFLLASTGIAYLIGVFLLCILAVNVKAFELYKTFQTPEVFLAEVFDNSPPAPEVLHLDSAAQSDIHKVFNRAFPQKRIRYWKEGDRSAWIFDDIGKEGYVPTTCGFVVRDGVIETARVLVYRESRGEQVAEPSFLKQLEGAKPAGSALDVEVDNITGATLSVRMMQRMARTALELDALASK